MIPDPNYSQGQFEFFSSQSRVNPVNGKRQLILRSLNVTVDNLVITGIVSVMALLVMFSLGVERGKRLALAEKNTVQNGQNIVSLHSSSDPSGDMAAATEAQTISAPPDDGPETALPYPAAVTVPVTSSLDEGFTVQIATYKGERRAKEVVGQLQKLGHESFFLSKGEYVVVCVGKFNVKDEAKRLSLELKKKFKDCYVRRI